MTANSSAEQSLADWIDAIGPLDSAAMDAARRRQDQLTKPRGSLGRLEDISVQLAGIFGHVPPEIAAKAVVVMAGDHGVAAEGVSAYPQEVTPQMVLNFLRGGAAINVLANHVGARVEVVDMGICQRLDDAPGLTVVHIAGGTANIARGPAMTRDQAVEAMAAGGRVAERLIAHGVNLIAGGDMGIANTTPSSAIIAAFTGRDPAEVVGRGTGIDDETMARKIAVVRRALDVNRPDPSDPIDVLAKVGGFEIAGIAGLTLAAAAHRCAVVCDGFIATAGVLVAAELQPAVKQYLFAGHRSQEPGHRLALDRLGLKPILDLDLRLGEGTGAALAMTIIEAAAKILGEMATFESAGVSEGKDK